MLLKLGIKRNIVAKENTSIEGQDLTNRYVLIETRVLALQYQNLNNRLFFCENGFGCSPITIGTAVFGTHPFDGEKPDGSATMFSGLPHKKKLIKFCQKKLRSSK